LTAKPKRLTVAVTLQSNDTRPHMLTLGQAAKETGLSKTAISRAIKSGRLSAIKNEQGEYQIDPAELFRVYPVTVNVDSKPERQATQKDNSGLQGQIELLREMVDDLRVRLNSTEEARQRAEQAQEKAFAELSRLTLLLTHQPKPEAEAQPAPGQEPQPTANQNKRPEIVRPWLWVALTFTVVFGVGAYLYLRQQ
jgi:hypothetical protein